MNEGHSSLLVMELLEERTRADGRTNISPDDIAEVRRKCIFTTHTPVPAGHDRFPMEIVSRIVGESPLFALTDRCCHDGMLNLTYLALNFSHYVNGVAMKHVHPATWAAKEFHELFDRHIPGWRQDNFSLRYGLSIPRQEVWNAHAGAKARLVDHVARQTSTRLNPEVLTVGFARRASTYKRADLLLHDVERLKALVATAGPVQVIYAGKAHPLDDGGKAVIERIFKAASSLRRAVPIVYLEDYDMELGRLLTFRC